MNTRFQMTNIDQDIVYVKQVQVSDLPEPLRDQAEGLSEIFAVHNSNGEQLALVASRDLAFVLARQNDMVPVGVH